jgi:uncharacterized protein (DUF2252 family)
MAQSKLTRRAAAAPRLLDVNPAQRQLAEGREARRHCPRSSHGARIGVDHNRDPLALLIASNADRLPELIPVRHSRMLESPFAFFRGSAALQAHDLTHTPHSGIRVQACGDCHLLNFGGFGTPERNLVFDINDFDETLPAPWEWDVKRLAVSFVLAARWRKFPAAVAQEAVMAAVSRYRGTMAASAKMPTLATWYAQITYTELEQQLRGQRKLAKRISAEAKQARRNTSEHVFHKLVNDSNGTLRIIDQPPLLYHPQFRDGKAEMLSFLKDYTATLRDEYKALMSRFTFVDGAIKVVGVGSVGTRCYVVLLLGEHGDPLFLQFKEARASVLEPYAGASMFRNHGQRVVTGQRMMQAVSDIFLGWARGTHGRDFYVRQLRDMKIAADLTNFNPSMLVLYARLCGWALAHAHAKTGASPRVAGYLGVSARFDEAIARYAAAYADQVERDYETFRVGARNGRVPTEISASTVATMIR